MENNKEKSMKLKPLAKLLKTNVKKIHCQYQK